MPEVAESIFNLAAASVLGAVIGLEREHHGREAGLRTQLLVALGSCLAMVVSLHFGKVFGTPDAPITIRVDPARVAYGVMSGVGFLGAGVIIQTREGVRGVTTAASLWCSAAIGLACGFSMYAVALATTSIVLFALTILNIVDHKIASRVLRTIAVTVPQATTSAIERYARILIDGGAHIRDTDSAFDFTAGRSTITYNFSILERDISALLKTLEQTAPEISHLEIR
jgi:putative Mg2+ transporter-C (MgtC) family protein